MNSNPDHFIYSITDYIPILKDSESLFSESNFQHATPYQNSKHKQSKSFVSSNLLPQPNKGQNVNNLNPYSQYQTMNKVPLYSAKLNNTPITKKRGIAEAFDSIKKPNEDDRSKSPFKQTNSPIRPVVKVPIEISKSSAKTFASTQSFQPNAITGEISKFSGESTAKPLVSTQISQQNTNKNPGLIINESINENLRSAYANLTKDFNDQIKENQRLRVDNDTFKRNVILINILV